MPATLSKSQFTSTASSILAILCFAGIAMAGPIMPPAGSVASTYKTLSEVEPRTPINVTTAPGDAQYEFVISQPGSYFFAGTMNFSGTKHAIKIACDNVSIDMNGFAMVCTASTGTAISTANIARNSIRISNGTIRGGFQGGITLYGAGHRIEKLTIQNTFGDAISLQTQAIIRECSSASNSGYGIICGSGSIISQCTVDANNMGGIYAAGQAVIEHCSANNSPASGIQTGRDSVIRDCTANDNSVTGIAAQGQSRVEGCTAEHNTSYGFNLGQDTQIRGCTARASNFGIFADFGCTVTECQADNCASDGFRLNGNALIQSCHAQYNVQDGINGGFTTTVLNCQVNNNFGAGIEVFGKGRIEGNDAISNAIGFKTTGTGALFIRNSATSSTNTNYSIAAGNTSGPIVTTANIATNTNPSANFSY